MNKSVEDLVPKDIFDCSGIEELRNLSDEEIIPVLPELLAWMKDMNWPVAKEMPSLLALHQKEVVPYIIEMLKPEQLECDWKTFVIWILLPLLDKQYLEMLRSSLERIVEKPTWGEIDERTNIAALDIIRENGWC